MFPLPPLTGRTKRIFTRIRSWKKGPLRYGDDGSDGDEDEEGSDDDQDDEE